MFVNESKLRSLTIPNWLSLLRKSFRPGLCFLNRNVCQFLLGCWSWLKLVTVCLIWCVTGGFAQF